MCSPKLLLVMSLFAFFFFTVAHFHLAGRQHFSFSQRQFPCFNSSSFVLYLTLYLFPCYRKIPKISPGAYIFQRPFLRGLSTEGNLRVKIDWASLIVGSKFTIFALFYFVFEGKYKPPRGLYLEGRLIRGFFALPVWGAYIWRGLYMEGLIFGVLR